MILHILFLRDKKGGKIANNTLLHRTEKWRNLEAHVHNSVHVQLDKNIFFQLKPNGKLIASDQAKQFCVALPSHSYFWSHKTFWIFHFLNMYQKENVWVNKKSRTSNSIIPKPFWCAVISSITRTGKIHTGNYILKNKKEHSKNTSYKKQLCFHQAKLYWLKSSTMSSQTSKEQNSSLTSQHLCSAAPDSHPSIP